MERYVCRGWDKMVIKTQDPEHKQFIEPINKKDYVIRTDKMPPGESIACIDDSDMEIIKQGDGSVVLKKRCFNQKCFIR